MKIEHLTNNIAKIGAELQLQFYQCISFNIATAFISADGIDILEDALQKNKRLKHGKLLVGMYGFFNQKSDLIRIKLIAQKYPDKISVHISKEKSFHWKYYQFEKRQGITFFVGSANLTSGGMNDNAELLVKITTVNSLSISWPEKLKSSFKVQWNNSEPISIFPLGKYPVLRRISKQGRIDRELITFFNKRIKGRSIDLSVNDKAVVCCLTQNVSASTERKIHGYNPTWVNEKIYYFVCDGVTFYNQCLRASKILIIEKWSRQKFTYCWTKVVDCCDSVKTPEGKYFVAYKIVGSEKNLNNSKQQILLDKFGINLRAAKRPFYKKTLGKRQVTEIKKYLK